MTRVRLLRAACAVWLLSVLSNGTSAEQVATPVPAGHPRVTFDTADRCIACHNGLTTPGGEDVSIGVAWRASMMANSSRDPYWHAAVRRETIDHPSKKAAIEDECSICHMPMARAAAHADGRETEVFSLLPSLGGSSDEHRLAADGVSCMLCHQIGPDRLGTRESFVGGFTILAHDGDAPVMAGPYDVEAGHGRTMRSATGVKPVKADHLQQSEVCATCHTLFTQALGPKGEVIGELPEQTPYQEWLHSGFAKERSCQSCHMPRVEDTPIASVLGQPRERLDRHTFLGGNFFMLRMLNRFRAELGVTALPQELEGAAQATLRQLESDTASVEIARLALSAGRVEADVMVRNVTGHKLPTGYPSRRVWLHVTLRDGNGAAVFESGRVAPDGAIAGNDNDADPTRVEPHYTRIESADHVQIYEAVMGRPDGRVTTGLLQATQFLKDNRLLPRGFDKATASPDIAVRGSASGDGDFDASGDRVTYEMPIPAGGRAPFTLEVVLRYQPIGFRWAANLRSYDAPEPQRFLRYFDAMAAASSAVLAGASASLAAP